VNDTATRHYTNPIRLLFLALGLGLLGYILQRTDLPALWSQVVQVGALGFGIILALYLCAFLADTLSWQLTFSSPVLDLRWFKRLFLVRTVGEALNNLTPLAGMGGEPVKAVLLKKYYTIDYRESAASLLLAKTTNLIALVVFLCGGFVLLINDSRLPASYQAVASVGLLALTAGTGLFFLVQRYQLSSLAGRRLSRLRIGRRLDDVLHHIRDFDERLVRFYTHHRSRFLLALLLALLNWSLGVLELYYAMKYLGVPVSLSDAWIIEAVAQLVRSGTFFIPASIGVQEGAFMLLCSALTGNTVVGLAAALLRRFREVLWILAGLALGWRYSLRPVIAEATAAND
jgi:glycosyltransferase 2 family protein